jgi:endoglucanase
MTQSREKTPQPRTPFPLVSLIAAAVGLFAMAVLPAASCMGVSQKRTAAASGAAAPSKDALATAGIKTCPGDTRPADDGDLDDFEDRDTQLTRISGRDGYWWTKKDDKGSTIDPSPFRPQEGGAGGSHQALRGLGETSRADGSWGAGFGANFSTKNPYDASRYVGIAFKAKVDPKSTRHFRFKIGDINTHKDAGVCTDCWNHFGADFDFTTEWKEYRVLFSNAPQEVGWGNPRPPTLTPSKLYSLDWSVGPGQTYDLWVDDITFLDCK